MKSNLKCWCGAIAAVILIVGLMAGSVSQVYAQAMPRIIPVQAPAAHGMTYSEWSARWWQWSVSLPVDWDDPENNQNPLMDYEDCANGANGQAGPVWFLTASFTGAVRTCNVPAGKFLFFPLINTECSTVEPDPWHGANEQELRDCAMRFAYADVFATIDGVDVTDLHQYFVISPMYNVTLPANNWWGVPAGSAQSVSTGYWLMVRPLPAGQHTIEFGGTIPNPPPPLDHFTPLTYWGSYILNIGR